MNIIIWILTDNSSVLKRKYASDQHLRWIKRPINPEQ